MSSFLERRIEEMRDGSTALASPEAELPETDFMAPLDVIETEHHKWLIVCDAMEKIADRLPELGLEPRLLGVASLCTRDAVARHHALEQEGLFPLVKTRLGGDATLAHVLDCMEEDHADLEDGSEEAAEILSQIRRRDLAISPDAAGYGLRCFFGFMRRHVRCELQVVLPAARRLLEASDTLVLGEALARHKRHDKVVPLEWFRRYASGG
jgi:hemerythrin-like domain-containing protein